MLDDEEEEDEEVSSEEDDEEEDEEFMPRRAWRRWGLRPSRDMILFVFLSLLGCVLQKNGWALMEKAVVRYDNHTHTEMETSRVEVWAPPPLVNSRRVCGGHHTKNLFKKNGNDKQCDWTYKYSF